MTAIVIPTLDATRGRATGRLALRRAGMKARLIVSAGPKRGFTKTVNDGIRQTKDEDICLLNDDMNGFSSGWLAALHRVLYSNSKYGIVGPSGKSSTPPTNAGKPGMRGVQVVDRLPFWCVLIRRELIDIIGLLDENFKHYGSDYNYCLRARKAGWRCVWAREVFLKHQQHGSGLVAEWAKADHKLLYRKRRR